MAKLESDVEQHYSGDSLAERILSAASQTGVTDFTPVALAPADEFHTGGLQSTRELANFAGLTPGTAVIDLGCGIGGPSRILASEFGCTVTGIDLTAEFIRTAQVLSVRCGLTDNPTFQQANALGLPFPDASFDVAWTQHVVMNIADRDTFYREAARVLPAGARLVFFDILQGPAGPVHFPAPWARTPDISHLKTPNETRAAIEGAGFQEVAWRDVTAQYIDFFRKLAANAPAASPLGLQIVIGPDIQSRAGNVMRSAEEGRVLFVQGIFEKQ